MDNKVIGSRYRKSKIHNMSVYAWAANLLQNKSVMELGCGRGDGMMIQSFFASEILGVDANKEEISNASRLPYFCPVYFDIKDLEREWSPGTFGAITAFEILEHLKDPRSLLKNAAKSTNLFICSVPYNQPDVVKPNTPFLHLKRHHRVFTDMSQFDKLLKPFFKRRLLYMERDGNYQKYFREPHRYAGICRN